MLKDLLVVTDNSEKNDKRVRYALQLAKRFEAHLTGLYFIPVYTTPPAVGAYLTQDMEARILEGELQRAEEAQRHFRDMVAAHDIAFETHIDKGPQHDHARMLSLHGRYADLTIIGQRDPESGENSLDPGDVVLAAGAPVMIVPHIGAPSTCGERIMVAWNASRESARAVRDAMPLLEKAKTVDISCFRLDQTSAHADLPGADIGLHLSRHGIKVNVQILEGTDIDVGNALLSHVADRGNDMLVMGGYGHSRLREAVLGGATRTVLQSMTVPVLMAH